MIPAAVLLPALARADAGDGPSRVVTWVTVGALLPLLAVGATAFAKFAVVLGILRGGLGVPGALPVPVVTALAAALAAVAMTPVGLRIAAAVRQPPPADAGAWPALAERAWPPLADFLDRHTRPADRELIADVAGRLDPDAAPEMPTPPMRVAAFMLSELTAAFELGVLLLIPFLLIDLIVANTLAVVGFSLLPPALVALPFKLLLFVAVDGWGLLVRGLVAAGA